MVNNVFVSSFLSFRIFFQRSSFIFFLVCSYFFTKKEPAIRKKVLIIHVTNQASFQTKEKNISIRAKNIIIKDNNEKIVVFLVSCFCKVFSFLAEILFSLS